MSAMRFNYFLHTRNSPNVIKMHLVVCVDSLFFPHRWLLFQILTNFFLTECNKGIIWGIFKHRKNHLIIVGEKLQVSTIVLNARHRAHRILLRHLFTRQIITINQNRCTEYCFLAYANVLDFSRTVILGEWFDDIKRMWLSVQ